MSTTFAASAIPNFSGPWSDGYQASAQCKYCQGQYSTFDFTATGTDLTCKVAVSTLSSTTIQVSVDGGAFTTVTGPVSTNTYTDLTLFSGLADSAHTVEVRITGGNWFDIFLHSATALALTGAAPAISAHSTFTGLTYYAAADLYGLGGVDGCWKPLLGFSFGYSRPQCMQCTTQDAVIRFRGNPTAVRLFCYTNSSRVRVYQDGVAVGSTVQTTAGNSNPAVSASQMGWVQVVSGLDGATHDYTIVASDSTGLVIAGVGLVGGTVDFTYTYPRRGAIAVLGDSITAALTGTSNDSTLGFGFKLAVAKNRPVYNGGVGSTFLMKADGTGGTDFRYTDATFTAKLFSPSVDYAVVLIGYNDINTSTAGIFPPGTAAFQQAYQNTLLGVRRSVGPACKILALGILPTTATNAAAQRATYNPLVSAAVTAMADANTSYVSTDSLWGTGGSAPTNTQVNNNTSDGTHPTSAGYDALVTLLSPSITTWAASGGGGGNLLGNGTLVAG